MARSTLKMVWTVAHLLAMMACGSVAMAELSSQNQYAFGEALQLRQSVSILRQSVGSPYLRDEAVVTVRRYVGDYFFDQYRSPIIEATQDLDWEPESVESLIEALNLGSQETSLYFDDEAVWYQSVGRAYAEQVVRLGRGQVSGPGEANVELTNLISSGPTRQEPFLAMAVALLQDSIPDRFESSDKAIAAAPREPHDLFAEVLDVALKTYHERL